MLSLKLFPQKAVKGSEEAKAKRINSLVSNLSNGNVSLQMGHYITKDQLSEKKKILASYTY